MDAADIHDVQDTVAALEDAVGYGSTYGTWPTLTAWVPVLTMSGSLTTTANTTTSARYCKIGKNVFFYLEIAWGLNGGVGSELRVTLPVTALNAYFAGGVAIYTGGTQLSGTWYAKSTTQIGISRYDGANHTPVSTTTTMSGMYEAA